MLRTCRRPEYWFGNGTSSSLGSLGNLMIDGAERVLRRRQRPQCLAGMSHDVSYRVQNTLPTPPSSCHLLANRSYCLSATTKVCPKFTSLNLYRLQYRGSRQEIASTTFYFSFRCLPDVRRPVEDHCTIIEAWGSISSPTGTISKGAAVKTRRYLISTIYA